MEVGLRVTDAPEESCFSDLVSGDNVLAIPLFQRAYRWTQKHLGLLIEDIDAIRDDIASSVFLGVIVSYSRGTAPGRPVTWEIVDGQQRITTLYLLLMAAVEVAARKNEGEWAADVSGTYLLVRPLASNPVNTKLIPSYADRAQFASLWTRIADLPSLKAQTTFSYNLPRPPHASGPSSGAMTAQYDRLRRILNGVFEDGGRPALERFVKIVAHHLSVVSISLRDPAVAPKIFERLNARAEPVTVADLVRNEIFARSGDDAIQAQHVFTTYWEPFIQRFKESGTDFEKFLFPYGLTLNPNVRKADLFGQLRSGWASSSSPQEIIEDLDRYRATFLAIEAGRRADDLPDLINKGLNRLHRVGRPSSTYVFIFQVVEAFRSGALSEPNVCSILDALESFLFRRAVMGIEPTGLHAAFKGLWAEVNAAPAGVAKDGALVRQLVSKKPTILWPTDVQFKTAIQQNDLYHRKVRAYALKEREIAVEGESPTDTFCIEHVAPQTPTEHWRDAIPESYEQIVQTWGNLIPLTDAMNPAVGQKPFKQKREEFKNSIFATAREVAQKYDVWTAKVIQDRNTEIGGWATSRWSY
jgi:hypothetical protein